MFNTARVRQDFNEAADSYDAHAALQQQVLQRLLALVGPIVPGALVLDAGCGTGAFARATGHRNTVALDNAYRMCKLAGGAAVNADMRELPFADGTFDIVFSSLALQWANDWLATLTQWKRVLKPGGMLAFSTFGAGTLAELTESFGTVDGYQHVSDFVEPQTLQRFLHVPLEKECITEYYADMLTLARHLKALGARNKERGGRPALMTPRQFRRAEQHYSAHYSSERGLRVSWNILYMVVRI